jgi:uncharacterized protein (TIGR00255 family)
LRLLIGNCQLFCNFAGISELIKMILSMTGFGKAVEQIPGKKITVELKSLNSKQFDMLARVPSAYRELELELRRMVAAKLERGKVDMVVTVEHIDGGSAAAQLNIPALAAYKEQILTMSKELNLPEPDDWYGTLLRLPDALRTDATDEISDDEVQALLRAVNGAVDALMNFRRTEGAKLEEFFISRVDSIAAKLAEVPRWESERVAKIRTRLEEGLSNIAQVEYDRGRLEQEMIYYIEKLDVNEERQRLGQHLAYFKETLAHTTPGQGKKLGFIAQEMGREINTLGSKSNHAEMQQLVVRMKDDLEQIKEQVLNVM